MYLIGNRRLYIFTHWLFSCMESAPAIKNETLDSCFVLACNKLIFRLQITLTKNTMSSVKILQLPPRLKYFHAKLYKEN